MVSTHRIKFALYLLAGFLLLAVGATRPAAAQTSTIEFKQPVSGQPGQTITVEVDLVSIGTEGGVSGTFTYDDTALTYVASSEVNGTGNPSGTSVLVNTTTAGQVTFATDSLDGTAYSSGTDQLFTLQFTINASTPDLSTNLDFTGSPTSDEVVDTSDSTLSSTFNSGSVTIIQPAATPNFSVPSESFNTSISGGVTITDGTPDATIYYTVTAGDTGTTPTTSSPVYNGAPITVTATETIEAIATAPGSSTSAAGSETYTLEPLVPTPTFLPTLGSFNGSTMVSIADADPNATIYYTETAGGTGTAPTTSSSVFIPGTTPPITVTDEETFEAFATDIPGNMSNSLVATMTYSPLPPAATPVLTPTPPASFNTSTTVGISDATPNATIYYTVTPGTTGTPPTTSSSVYTPGTTVITLTATSVVEAIAVSPATSTSLAASGTYTLEPLDPTPTFSPSAGPFNTSTSVTISDTDTNATIYYTITPGGTGTTPTTSSAVYHGAPIPVSATETIEALATDTGNSNSLVGSATYTLEPFVPTPVLTPPSPDVFHNSVNVTIGDSDGTATIYYTVTPGSIGTPPTTSSAVYTPGVTQIQLTAASVVEAFATDTNMSDSAVATGTYSTAPLTATPIIAPGSEAFGAGTPVSVSISDTQPNAIIYYTTDGSTPYPGQGTTAVYSGSFNVTTSETVNAIAVASGFAVSQEATTVYTLVTTVTTPTFSPAAETFPNSVQVTISDSTVGSTIYFTTDGTTPAAGQGTTQIYSGPITLTATTTVNAMATATGLTNSDVGTSVYTLAAAAATPVIAPAPGTETNFVDVTITDGTSGSTIYYTTDGSTPTTSSNQYVGQFELTTSGTVNAIATAPSFTNSAVATAAYTVNQTTRTIAAVNASGSVGGSTVVVPVTLTTYGTENIVSGSVTFNTADLTYVSAAIGPDALAANGILALNTTGTGTGAIGFTITLPYGTAFPAGTEQILDVTFTVAAASATTTPVNFSSVPTDLNLVDINGNVLPITSTAGMVTITTEPVVATPTFSPASESFNGPLGVSLSDTTPDSTIYYTTNGTTPTTSSAQYGNTPIAVTSTTTIEAIAVASGDSNSDIASATYTQTPTATPQITPQGATFIGSKQVTITDSTAGAVIYYTTDGSTPTTASPDNGTSPVTFTVSSYSIVQAIAVAPGYAQSAMEAATFTQTPVPTPTITPGTESSTTAVSVTITDSLVNGPVIEGDGNNASPLMAGTSIYYTTDGSTPVPGQGTTQQYTGTPLNVTVTTTVNAIATHPGYANSAVATATYTIAPATPTPTFTPTPGSYANSVSVSLLDTAQGAAIYYTLDGSPATTSSTLYTGAINVTATTTINAIALASGDIASPQVSATYTIEAPAPTPTFSPVSEAFANSVSVAISDTATGAAIYYTTDGTTPTTSSTQYTGPVTVTSTETINAIAVVSGSSNSAVGSATYTLEAPAATPIISPSGGTFSQPVQVTITDATPNATIYYTTDGTTPTTSSNVYNGPFTVSASETITAIAAAAGLSNSTTSAQTYTLLLTAATPGFTPGTEQFGGSVSVTITDATPNAVIYYTTDGTVPAETDGTPAGTTQVYSAPITLTATTTVNAIAVAAGFLNSSMGTAVYTLVPFAATPILTPGTESFLGTVRVTITDATSGASIFYTTDGSTPTTSSTPYTGPITLSATATVKAIATASGFATSQVGSGTYTLEIATATPTISPDGGSFNNEVSVTFDDATPGAHIYFTLDGSTPTTASNVYVNSPIDLTSTTTVNAIAVAAGLPNSAVASATFTINYGRTVQAGSVTGTAGDQVTVPITIAASGVENAISGTLTFDPTVLTYDSVAAGADDGSATILPNSSQASSGSLGLAIALPAGGTLAAGEDEIALVTFTVAAGATGSTTVGWSNTPVTESVASASASALTATFNSGTVTISSEPILHTFPAGLSMISAPVDDTGFTLAQQFDQVGVVLATWDAATTSYVVSPTAPANTLTPGTGYWGRFAATTDLLNVGTPVGASQAVSVSLAQGWNLIGVPRSQPVPGSDLSVQVGSTTYTVREAVDQSVIDDSLFTYQSGDVNYEVSSISSGSMQPYEAYWLYANEDCTLVFAAQ